MGLHVCPQVATDCPDVDEPCGGGPEWERRIRPSTRNLRCRTRFVIICRQKALLWPCGPELEPVRPQVDAHGADGVRDARSFDAGPFFVYRCSRYMCVLRLPPIAPMWTSPAAVGPSGNVASGPPPGTCVVAPVL